MSFGGAAVSRTIVAVTIWLENGKALGQTTGALGSSFNTPLNATHVEAYRSPVSVSERPFPSTISNRTDGGLGGSGSARKKEIPLLALAVGGKVL